MEITKINPFQDRRWDEFVFHHQFGTIFHTSSWARVIQKTYGYEPIFMAVIDTDQKIRACLPLFFIKSWLSGNHLACLPFTDQCYPLSNGDGCIGPLLARTAALLKNKKADYIEIRGGTSVPDFVQHEYYRNFVLELSGGIPLLWRGLRQKSIKYPINKAKRLGVKIVKGVSGGDLKDFYRLNLLTRRKHGVIPQPFKFFENLYEMLLQGNHGFMLLAKYNGITVAASIFISYKKTIYHKYNASNEAYVNLCPNHLIIWTAIEQAQGDGFEFFDLGRTAPDNHGLMAFKKHWGAREFDLSYYYWPRTRGAASTAESSMKYRIASSIVKKSPIPAARLAGKIFYRHFG